MDLNTITSSEPEMNPVIIEKTLESTEDITPIYGDVSFSMPGKATVYPARFGGGKSVILAQFALKLTALGIIVEGGIWSRLETVGGDDRVVTDVSFPKQLKDLGGLDDLKRHVAYAAYAWSGYELASQMADDRLSGKADKVKDGKVAFVLPPRLVKKVIAAAA